MRWFPSYAMLTNEIKWNQMKWIDWKSKRSVSKEREKNKWLLKCEIRGTVVSFIIFGCMESSSSSRTLMTAPTAICVFDEHAPFFIPSDHNQQFVLFLDERWTLSNRLKTQNSRYSSEKFICLGQFKRNDERQQNKMNNKSNLLQPSTFVFSLALFLFAWLMQCNKIA